MFVNQGFGVLWWGY